VFKAFGLKSTLGLSKITKLNRIKKAELQNPEGSVYFFALDLVMDKPKKGEGEVLRVFSGDFLPASYDHRT
jgi:hypothetical protein